MINLTTSSPSPNLSSSVELELELELVGSRIIVFSTQDLTGLYYPWSLYTHIDNVDYRYTVHTLEPWLRQFRYKIDTTGRCEGKWSQDSRCNLYLRTCMAFSKFIQTAEKITILFLNFAVQTTVFMNGCVVIVCIWFKCSF